MFHISWELLNGSDVFIQHVICLNGDSKVKQCRVNQDGALRDELFLALFAGRVLVVFGARHGHLGRVALLVQQLLEGVQLVALVQGREISRLQHVNTNSTKHSLHKAQNVLSISIWKCVNLNKEPK